MPQNYSSLNIWAGFIAFAILCSLLLLGNIIRRKIPLFRKSLLPTAVIGGLLALAVKELILVLFVPKESIDYFNTFAYLITYHTIALGFIAMGLKVNEKTIIKTNRAHNYYNGMVIVATYLLQGIIGMILTYLLAYSFFPEFKSSVGITTGLLLPFGFGQGPGQANNFGNIYQSLGMPGAQSYGLAIASMGFIWACVGGVIYLTKQYKSGKAKSFVSQKNNLTSVQEIETPDEIPVAESIDKFTIQISLVMVVYIVTYLLMFGITKLTPLLGNFGTTLDSLIWGFNFIFGMIVAIIFKKVFLVLRKKNIMTRQYPNNFMLNRISGTVFDFMVIASIAAIEFEDLKGKWIPLLLITTIGGILTIIYLKKICDRVYKEYPLEGFSGMYGMLTGTASTGIALLREVDPNFETPAATDLVTGSTTAILFGFPILLLAGYSPISMTSTLITTIALIILFFLFNSFLLWKNPKVK